WTAASEGIAFQILRADVDLDGALNFGHHVDGGEGSLASRVGIERTDADEAVDPAFALEIAIGEIARDVERRTANTGRVIAQLIDDLRLVTMPLSPPGVHAQKHLRPVTGFGAACTGLDSQVGGARVLGTAQHGLPLEIAS